MNRYVVEFFDGMTVEIEADRLDSQNPLGPFLRFYRGPEVVALLAAQAVRSVRTLGDGEVPA